MRGQPIRIFYAAGPGDVLQTFHHWKLGKDDPGQVSVTYSSLFFDLVRKLGAEAYILSSNSNAGYLQEGAFTIEHRPTPFHAKTGPFWYHVGQLFSALRVIWLSLYFQADIVVVSSGTCHWFPLRLLPLFGIRVAASLHCVLHRKNEVFTGLKKFIRTLDQPFFAHTAEAILTVSTTISEQVRELGAYERIHEFTPVYRAHEFAAISAPCRETSAFSVLFVGRVERDKGVFDLLQVAEQLRQVARYDIEFDLCGTGTALADLRAAIAKAGLGDVFRCHGHCDKERMREMFARSQAIIVPTKSSFVEGFNKVVAEGVLAGRPVVTSSVCPAVNYLRDAVIEVPADNVSGYFRAILDLCDDRELYRHKAEACGALRERFYDLERGWGATLERVVRSMNPTLPSTADRALTPAHRHNTV